MRNSLKHLGAFWLILLSIMLSSHVRSQASETPTLESIEISDWVRLSENSGKILVKFNITNPLEGSRIDDLHFVKQGGDEVTAKRLNSIDASKSPVVVEFDLVNLNSNGRSSLYIKGLYHDKDGNLIKYSSNAGNQCSSWNGTQCSHGYSFDNNIGEVSTVLSDVRKSAIVGGNFRRHYKEGKEGGPEGWFDPMKDENGNYTGEIAFTVAPANNLGADYYRIFAVGTNGENYGLDATLDQSVRTAVKNINFASTWHHDGNKFDCTLSGNNLRIAANGVSNEFDVNSMSAWTNGKAWSVKKSSAYKFTATVSNNSSKDFDLYVKVQEHSNANDKKSISEKTYAIKAGQDTPIDMSGIAEATIPDIELYLKIGAPEGTAVEFKNIQFTETEDTQVPFRWNWKNIDKFEVSTDNNNIKIKAQDVNKNDFWANRMTFWCEDGRWTAQNGSDCFLTATATNDAAEDFDILVRVEKKGDDKHIVCEKTVQLKAGQPTDIYIANKTTEDLSDLELYLCIGNAPEGASIELKDINFFEAKNSDNYSRLKGGEFAYAQINANGGNPVSGTLKLKNLFPYEAIGGNDKIHILKNLPMEICAVAYKNDGTAMIDNSLKAHKDVQFSLLPQENLGLDFSWWHGEFMEQTGSLHLYPKYAYTDADGNWIYAHVLDRPVTVTHSIQSYINDNAGYSTDQRAGRGNGHSWWDGDNSQWVHPYFDVRLADYWVKMETSGKLKRNARIRTGVTAKAVFVKVDPTVGAHNPEVDGYSTPAPGYGPYQGEDGKLLTDVNTSLNRAYKVLFSTEDRVKEGIVDDPGENFDQYYLRALSGTPLYNLLQSAGVGVRENNGESYIDVRFVSHGRGQGFYQVNLGRELRLSRDQEFQFVIDHDGNKSVAERQFAIDEAEANRFNNTTSNVMMEANTSGKSVIKQGIAFNRIILQVLPAKDGGYSYSIYLAQKGADGDVQLPYGFNSLTDAEVMPVPSLKIWVNDENSAEPENTSGIVRLENGRFVDSADNSGFFEGLHIFDTDLNPGYMFSGNTAFIPFRPLFDGGIKDGQNYVMPGKVVKSGDRLTVEKPAEAALSAEGWRQIPNLYYIDIPEGITLSPERIIDGTKKFTYPSFKNEKGESPEFEFWQLPYQTWREQQAGDGNFAMRDDEHVVRDVFRQFNFFNIEGENGLEAATPENGGQWFYANAWWCANPNIRDREGNLSQRFKPGTTGDLVIGQKMKVYGITLFRIVGNRWNMYSNRTGDNKYDDGNLYYVYFNTLPGRGPELTCPILLDRFGDTAMEFDDSAEGVDMPEYFFPREVFYTDRYATDAELTTGTDFNMPIVRNLLAKKLKYGGLNPNGDAEYIAMLKNNARTVSRADSDEKDAEGYYPQNDYNFRFIDVTSTQYWGGDNADVLLPSKYSYYYAGQRLAARFDVVARSAKDGNTFTKIRDNHRFNIFGGRTEDAADTDHSGNILGGLVHTSSYPLLLELVNNGENKDVYKDFYENEGSGYNVPGGVILGRTKVDYSRIVIATNYDNARFMIKANVPVMTAVSDKYTTSNPENPAENVVYPVSTVTLQTPYSDSDLANLPEGERFFTVSLEIAYKDENGNPDGSQKIEERFYVDYEKNEDGSYKKDENGNLIMTGTARTRKPEGADDTWQPIVVNIQRFDEDNASEEIYLNHDENLVQVDFPILLDTETVDHISATMSVGNGTPNPANDVNVNYSIPEANVTIDAEFVKYSDDGRTITADVDWTSPAINESMPDMPHNYTVWAWDEKERIDAGDPEITDELFKQIVESGNIPSYWHVVETKTGNEHNTYPFEANYSLYETSQDIDGVWSWKIDLRYGVQLEYIAAYPKRDDDNSKRGSEVVSAEAPEMNFAAVPENYHADPYTAYAVAKLPYQVQTGIDDIETIDDGTPRYFDIQGYEVADPQTGRVYIRITPKGAVKVRF